MAYNSTQTYGGTGGGPFQDDLTQVCRLVEINLAHGKYIDRIQAVWQHPDGSRVSGQVHGGPDGTPVTIPLQPGEKIVRVDLRADKLVDQLTFTTNEGRKYGPYGGGGGNPYSLTDLVSVTGFVGGSGKYVDRIGFWIPAKCP